MAQIFAEHDVYFIIAYINYFYLPQLITYYLLLITYNLPSPDRNGYPAAGAREGLSVGDAGTRSKNG